MFVYESNYGLFGKPLFLRDILIVTRESIKMEGWHVEEDRQNVWKGTGTDASRERRSQLAISLDKVWNPNASRIAE